MTNRELTNEVYRIRCEIAKLRTATHRTYTYEDVMARPLESLARLDVTGERLIAAEIIMNKLHNHLLNCPGEAEA